MLNQLYCPVLVLYQWSYSLLEIVLMSLKSTSNIYKVVSNKNMVCLVKNSKNIFLKFCFFLKNKNKKNRGLKPTFEKKLKSKSCY
jgi:hypothetical protein